MCHNPPNEEEMVEHIKFLPLRYFLHEEHKRTTMYIMGSDEDMQRQNNEQLACMIRKVEE